MAVSRCELTKHKRMKVNEVSIERSQITKRHPTFSNPNTQVKRFDTPWGTLTFSISNRTMRTIDKYGSLKDFLTKFKRSSLSEQGLILRRKMVKHYKIQYKTKNSPENKKN